MKDVRLYDSKSKQLVKLNVKEPGKVTMYFCGPTVYNHAHIGNARPLIVSDNLRRLLKYIGYEVKFISNYTDVDDKIINEAKKENLKEEEITNKYIKAYEDVRLKLNAPLPDFTPRVTNYMDKIIDFIAKLVEKGYAYQVNGDVYFSVNKIKEYGEISNRNIHDLLVGARIEENESKENALDFCLWKETKEGIKWDSPWSKGRPGWHTECVAMINDLTTGTYVDIHGGGMDLKFPHHENEQAQARAYCGHELAGIWMHNGMLNIDNEKMSKSLGNVILAKDMINNIGGQTVRWIMNSTHYRAPINFSKEVVENATLEINKIYMPLKQASLKLALANYHSDKMNAESIDKYLNMLCDDLNVPGAITLIFDEVKKLNALIRTKEINYEDLALTFNTLNEMLDLIGMEKYNKVLSKEDIELYNKWNEYKMQKDFANADLLRSKLQEKGII